MNNVSKSPIRVMLVDDNELVRNSYRRLLNIHYDITVIAEANSGEQCLLRYQKNKPDIVVMDLSMGDMGGMETVKQLVLKDPKAKVLVFSVHESEVLLARVIKAGARGFLTKRNAQQVIAEALRKIARGERYFDPQFVFRIMARKQDEDKTPSLTAKESEVFQLLVQGYEIEQITEFLCIRPNTVKEHRSHIMKKLGASNILELTLIAARNGIAVDRV